MKRIKLGNADLFVGKIPANLSTKEAFEAIWNMHPDTFNIIQMYTKQVPIPRWQQAFGKNYLFSKQISKAAPINDILEPYLKWAQSFNIKYNGLLLNWYDPDLHHYIGKHRDSEIGLVKNSAIITISLGATRKFRLRELGQKGFEDIEVANGDVVVIPWKINKKFTHEVPYLEAYPGRRISITIRAFE